MHTPCTWQVAALRQLFVPDEAQAAVWRLLGAILLLGEVTLTLTLTLLGEVTFEQEAEGHPKPKPTPDPDPNPNQVTFEQDEGQGGAARPVRPEALQAAEEAF